jgi:two-component sensor histidine kinase
MHQTFRHVNNHAEFEKRFTERIQSLARLHALLSDNVWQGTDLHALIRGQLLENAEKRIRMRGSPARLSPPTAQNLALMLHELGTNAMKYGALSSFSGFVTISWAIEDATLRLRWIERGGPPPIGPINRGFGRTLIESGAESEGGEARLSVEAEGIVWDIAMPLRDAIEVAKH